MITSAGGSIGTLQNFLSREVLDGSLLSYRVEVQNSFSEVEVFCVGCDYRVNGYRMVM